MKRSSIFLFTLLLMVVFSIPASAAPNENDLIAPLEDAFSKNNQEVDQYLKMMGFTEDELAPLSTKLKKEIASNGGIKIKVEQLDPEERIIDKDGNDITNSRISIQDYNDSKFSLYGLAIKTASGTTENTYDIYAQYVWKSRPNFAFTDTLAMSWQSQVTPFGSPYSVHNWRNDPFTHQYTNSIQNQQNEGNSVLIDLLAVDSQQDGYIKQTVKVSKSYQGTTGSVSLGYAHKIIPGIVSTILNYFSISFSGSGYQEFTDRFNFTY
ncbi:hypothetical protein [Paenibacillus bouchesdurhonensis]|uniref:hypothetical protein n=1 Tax=Paenibacillus bouchesdurhonensis TaxID=1870990 RepID=UPI000DA617F8|nr:hypothetical protein [Paenibacillus bouchesdurhonensis]